MSRLHVIFPQTMLHALDLVDQSSVTKVVSDSGRELFQVNIHIYQIGRPYKEIFPKVPKHKLGRVKLAEVKVPTNGN